MGQGDYLSTHRPSELLSEKSDCLTTGGTCTLFFFDANTPTVRLLVNLAYSVLMAKGMTTDVYPRDNCIAPDIVFIVWTTNTKSACARVGLL